MPYLVVIIILLFPCLLSPRSIEAVTIDFDPATNYGIVNQKGIVEVPPTIDTGLAQEIATMFAGSAIYIKVTDPSSSFLSSPSFSILNGVAGGWYLTLKPGSSSSTFVGSFIGKTTKPIVIEISPVDTAFVKEIKSKYPAVSVHTGAFLYWPREEVKTTLAEVTPPTLEAISFQVEDPNTSDMFASVKLIFDTFFDASNDIPGTSIKIKYPLNTILSLSDIRPHTSFNDAKKTAWRMAIASCATTTSIQTQKKLATKAPIRYINFGSIAGFSESTRIISSRYARFLFLQPSLVWPVALAGNGGPYDEPKPIAGAIGTIQGKSEGILINTSSEQVPVSLPSNTGSRAYSSLVGPFTLTSSLQLSAYETVVFGDSISNTSLPPVCSPTVSKTQPTAPETHTASPQQPSPTSPNLYYPTSQPQNIPTPISFSFPIVSGGKPIPYPTAGSFEKITSLADIGHAVKFYTRYAVVKVDPLLKTPVRAYDTIRLADAAVESSIESLWQALLTYIESLLKQ